MEVNTSGQGKDAVVPSEISGKWNWGAFTFNWIWALANKVPLSIVPAAIGWQSEFARKANTLAWQYKRWQNVQQFQFVQNIWSIFGFIVFCAMITGLIWIIFAAIQLTL